MKNYKFPLLGLTLLLLIYSCKKEDVQSTKRSNNSVASAAKASGWMSLNNWSTSKNDSMTTYFSAISDTTISEDVAKSGLVLVYVKNGSQTQLLPFQDQTSDTYWYYQVSKGSTRINGENNSGEHDQDLKGKSFFYIVITSQQLSKLQSEGKSKFDLMQLSYSEASDLLK